MLYLASQSPRRRQLLRTLHRPFRVVPSAYREMLRPRESPAAHVIRHAIGKARRAQLPRGARGIVIGADTVLYFRRRIIGKPPSLAAARRLLAALSGRRHWVYTGLCLRDVATDRIRTAYERTEVLFKPLRPETVAALVRRMSPLDKAGGYNIQNPRVRRLLIARITGSRSSMIGLPLDLLRRELRRIDCVTAQ